MHALSLSAVLSLGIEVFQFVIPGRDPSLADATFNVLGAVLGIAVARSASVWWRPGPRTADRLVIAGTLAAMSVLALTGVLVGPSFPEETYYGGWTPRFDHLHRYGGRVLEASLGEVEIPPGVIGRSPEVHQRLLSDPTLRVHAEAGPRPAGLAPLLTIKDAHRREILLLGVDGDDLVYRYRTRAMDWGLIGPDIRAAGLLRGIVSRDPMSLVVRRTDAEWCIRLNTIERCGHGHTIGTGWTLLLGWQPVALRLGAKGRMLLYGKRSSEEIVGDRGQHLRGHEEREQHQEPKSPETESGRIGAAERTTTEPYAKEQRKKEPGRQAKRIRRDESCASLESETHHVRGDDERDDRSSTGGDAGGRAEIEDYQWGVLPYRSRRSTNQWQHPSRM